MYKLALILVTLFISSPCVLSQTEVEIIKKKLQGTWEWAGSGICQRTSNGLGFPADSSRVIVINNNRFKEFRNDTLFSVFDFQISEKTDYPTKSKMHFFKSSLYNGMIQLWPKEEDTSVHLSISNCYMDGWFYSFKRR